MNAKRILQQDEVNKRIMSQGAAAKLSESEVLNADGLGRRETQRLYAEKMRKFDRCLQDYRDRNRKAQIASFAKLDIESTELIDQQLVEILTAPKANPPTESDYKPNGKFRYRTVRRLEAAATEAAIATEATDSRDKISERGGSNRLKPEKENYEEKDKVSDRWFVRYLTLNRFVEAARAVIVRDRMLRRLRKLQAYLSSSEAAAAAAADRLNEGTNSNFNVSYAECFQRFLH